ncbi:MAG TPA: TSUP family transporter, partial [Candidatus Thermoplasmatota archaeon]|nr:TSUP family transporter [Candidatus Thermoplasmatota archaeon]
MDPLTVAVLLLLVSVLTGFLGSLLGLGGGFLLVPVMTLALGIDIRVAVAVSIVAVVATSTGSGAASVRRGI